MTLSINSLLCRRCYVYCHYCDEMAEARMMRSSLQSSTIPQLSAHYVWRQNYKEIPSNFKHNFELTCVQSWTDVYVRLYLQPDVAATEICNINAWQRRCDKYQQHKCSHDGTFCFGCRSREYFGAPDWRRILFLLILFSALMTRSVRGIISTVQKRLDELREILH